MADTTQKSAEKEMAAFTSEEYSAGEPVAPPAAPEPKKEDVEEAAPAKDAAEPPAEDGEQPPAAGKEGDPPKKTAQERINEITRARREAERRAEAAEAKARELEARLNAPPPQSEKKEEPKKEEPVADDPNAPKPDKYDYGELDSRYIRDLARYEADKRFNELRQQDQQEREKQALEEKQSAARAQFETMIERGSKVHDDFYEKVVIGSESGVWPLSQTMGEMVLASEVGNEIAYHLATNPEEADRVYRSSPVEQARYFGKMEAKFSAGQAAAPSDEAAGKPATPRTPKAPAPVDQARGASGQFEASADTDDFSSFEARANSRS